MVERCFNKLKNTPDGERNLLDNTRQYINVLLILLSEPKGKVPLFIDDWQPFRPPSYARALFPKPAYWQPASSLA